MATETLKRVAFGNGASGGFVATSQTSVYTSLASPATQTILKSIRVVNTTTSDVQFQMWIGGTTNDFLVIDEPVAGSGELQDDSFFLLEAGEQIYVKASLASALAVRISGMTVA